MTGINHIAGGIAFTGIFASFSDINIFASPADLAVTVFFSLLPDIDHTKSILGKLFFPIARYLDTHFGHRTLTHSLVCWLAVSLLAGLVFKFFNAPFGGWGAASLAYLSHLIFDMCTKSGIPFFYPFSSARCVIPGNPAMRMPTGNLTIETLVFFVFNSLTLTCYPLMNQGFWMTYNNAFKTFSHLQNEYRRSQDGLEVTFQTKSNTPLLPAPLGEAGGVEKGLVVATKENEAIVFLSSFGKGSFKEIREENTDIIAFRHPSQKLLREKVAFADISEDSLRKLTQQPIILLALHSNQPLHYTENGELKTGKTIRLAYAQSFYFSVETTDSSDITNQIYQQEDLIRKEKEKYKEGLDSLQAVRHHLGQLEKIFPLLSDYEKGKAVEKIKRLKDWQERFYLHSPEIEGFERELSFLKSQLQPKPVFNGYVISLKIE
ncbi:MAG: metal-dependent hydrolase [Verrucomicrobia bacterium]|nr:metal-dependent hydrolase [Cytophagales bacterium]